MWKQTRGGKDIDTAQSVLEYLMGDNRSQPILSIEHSDAATSLFCHRVHYTTLHCSCCSHALEIECIGFVAAATHQSAKQTVLGNVDATARRELAHTSRMDVIKWKIRFITDLVHIEHY